MNQHQPGPADLLGPKDVLDAQESGRAAAWAGNGPDTCPWKSPVNDRERAQQAMWVRGYSQGRTELRDAAGASPQPRQSPTETEPR